MKLLPVSTTNTDQNMHVCLLYSIRTGCRMTKPLWMAIRDNDVQALSRILDQAPFAMEMFCMGHTRLSFVQPLMVTWRLQACC